MIKNCSKCGVEYPRTKEYFVLDNRRNDGLGSQCRKCQCTATAIWQEKNKEKRHKYFQKNKRNRQEYAKKYHQTVWGYVKCLIYNIKNRCTNKKHDGYKYYGGRGIKCLFTAKELYDWLLINEIDPRDLQIHRIDNIDNYTLDNIRFLTQSEHIRLHWLKRRF